MNPHLMIFQQLIKKILVLILCIGIFSCASKKDVIYFQDASEMNLAAIEKEFQPIIEVNDILHITLTSLNQETLEPFLRIKEAQQGNTAYQSNPGLSGYLVNVDGTIGFPVLGSIKVEGFTRQYIEDYLKKELKKYIEDIVVDVRIMNFKVTVIGEVTSPGVFQIVDERVTLMEALALAGDLTEYADRHAITIIREENDIQKVTKIDLTTAAIYNSPYYFLKQNDLVYVEPSKKGVVKTGHIDSITTLLAVLTITLSSIIIITNIK